MKTTVVQVRMDQPLEPQLEAAADILRKGGTVAFPTETVYGLGANALDADAVDRIYRAKGRPSDNPLIVHIGMSPEDGNPQEAVERSGLVQVVPSIARTLMMRFWPGPLTLVMPKSDRVPYKVTGGLDTVGVRMPIHPVALALLHLAGIPVAAPSANTSGKPSPTAARHVIEDLYGKVDMILDGGACQVGLESTVVDATREKAVILRPGGVTAEQIADVLGEVQIDPGVMEAVPEDAVPRSPGMKYKHYSPKAEVTIVRGMERPMASRILELVHEALSAGKKVGILATDQTMGFYQENLKTPLQEGKCILLSAGNRDKPVTIAENLFGYLREFDRLGADSILAEAVDVTGIGLAIMNRMNRAAAYQIIDAASDCR